MGWGMFVAALLGLLSGVRTFTAPAVLMLMRRPSPFAYLLGVLALGEYAGDLHPSAPARTAVVGLVARACSGAFCGWQASLLGGTPAAGGALVGALAAVVGAYVSLALRLRAITLIGRVPAALLEDATTIAAGIAVVGFLL
jgi:uncharacterized membrane protein